MRSVKHGKKRKTKYRYARNSVNSKAKALKKQKDKEAKCVEVAAQWDKKRSAKHNIESMGLVYDVNKAIKPTKTSKRNAATTSKAAAVLEEAVPMEVVSQVGSVAEQKKGKGKKTSKKQQADTAMDVDRVVVEPVKQTQHQNGAVANGSLPGATKGDVAIDPSKVESADKVKAKSPEKPAFTSAVAALEKAAAEEEQRQRRERVYKLLPQDVMFCVKMIEKHQDDFDAMARDSQNHYQETAKQIARKVRVFKESPQFQTYLNAKKNGTLYDAHNE